MLNKLYWHSRLHGRPEGWRDAASRVVARLLPRRVCYWALIRVGTAPGMILPHEEVPAVAFTQVLDRWLKP